MAIFFSNLPELLMWSAAMGVTFYAGRRYERWKLGRATVKA